MNVWRTKVDGIVFVSRASRLAMSSSVKASARPPTAVAEQFPKRAPLSAISPNKIVGESRNQNGGYSNFALYQVATSNIGSRPLGL